MNNQLELGIKEFLRNERIFDSLKIPSFLIQNFDFVLKNTKIAANFKINKYHVVAQKETPPMNFIIN